VTVLVRQPIDSSLCGQCCVAMAAGVSLTKAIEAVGHGRRGGTSTREIIAALRRLGVRSVDRCHAISRARPEYPRRALLVMRQNGNRRWHWVYYENGQFHDPQGRWPDYDGWRVTSYLELD
jgi:hypothetical protein